MKRYWNSHFIRKSTKNTVSGRPNELYRIPQNTVDQLHVCSQQDANDMQEFVYKEEDIYDQYFKYLFERLALPRIVVGIQHEPLIFTYLLMKILVCNNEIMFKKCQLEKYFYLHSQRSSNRS